jgi:hypothetical protein
MALGAILGSVAPSTGADKEPAREKEWYSPREADFKPEYERDKANQARESYREYLSWVKQFYQGNLFSRGWTAQGTALLQTVREEQARDELRATLNDLGRRIAAEWSKDNGLRKINTVDLRNFGKRLQQARARDDGSGAAIREAIDAVRADVKDKLSGP